MTIQHASGHTIGRADLEAHAGPAYAAIADAIARAIDDGRLKAGDRLPPQRDLAWQLKVTVGTIGRAYEIAGQRGLVRGEVGRGTYVLDRAPPAVAALHHGKAPRDGSIDLVSNVASPTPAQAGLKDAMVACAQDPRVLADLLGYPPTLGLDRHRARAADWLVRQGVPATAATTVITSGAQPALALAVATLAPPGSTILVEQLTYNGIRTLGRRLGVKLEPVALDEEGVVPEALAAAALHTGATVAVLTPNLHNPTTACMGAARREAIAAVARAYGLWLIEDDVYGPLLEAREPPLAALAPERTLHVSSASKFLAPGLRVGFACVPAELVEPLADTSAQLVLANPPLMAEIFVRCLDTGVAEAAVVAQRAEAAARQALAARVLGNVPRHALPTGLHIWLPLPDAWTSAEFALVLARDRILVSPAERFHVGRSAPPRAVRVSISAPADREQLEHALKRITALFARPSLGSTSLI